MRGLPFFVVLGLGLFSFSQGSFGVKVNGQDLASICTPGDRKVTYASRAKDVSMQLQGDELQLGTINPDLGNIVQFYQDNRDVRPSLSAGQLNLTSPQQHHTNVLNVARETMVLKGQNHVVKQSLFKAGQGITLAGDAFDFQVVILDTPRLILKPFTQGKSIFESIEVEPMASSPYPFSFVLNGKFSMGTNRIESTFSIVGAQSVDITFSEKAFGG